MKLSIPLVIVAIVAGITGLAGENAYAQQLTFVTSADEHDNKFFGEAVVQIIIIDPDADDDAIEDISVEIEAKPDIWASRSIDITVPETNDGSGRFEFFLAHIDADAVGPADLDSRNGAGVEGDGTCMADCAPFVTFGLGGDLDIAADLYEDVEFEIQAGNSEITINYEETDGLLELDRDSYGTTSFVYISIVEQDANLNPFERDQITVDPDAPPNEDLLTLDGGSLVDAIVFRETGDNTAVFEGRYRLGESMTMTGESLVLTLHEKANYEATLDALENDSNNIDEINFIVGNSDGSISVVGGEQTEPTWDASIKVDKDLYQLGESVHVTVTDMDANFNSSAIDFVQLNIVSRGNNISVSATETSVNSGTFEASFLLAETTGTEAITPGNAITITYTDQHPADYFEQVQAGQDPKKDFALVVDIQLPIRTGIETIDIAHPIASDISGGQGPYTVGDSVTLSTTVLNNNNEPQQFLVLIEVRDATDSTIYLALQGGMLEPSGSADVGSLWQPSQPGTFQVRTFVMSNLIDAEVLSPVAVSDIIIT